MASNEKGVAMSDKETYSATYAQSSMGSIQDLNDFGDDSSESGTAPISDAPTASGDTLKKAASCCRRSIVPQRWSREARRSRSIDKQLEEDRRRSWMKCTALLTGQSLKQSLVRTLEVTNSGDDIPSATCEELKVSVRTWVRKALRCLLPDPGWSDKIMTPIARQLLAEMDESDQTLSVPAATSIEMLWSNRDFRTKLVQELGRDASPLDDILINARKMLQQGYSPTAADVAFIRRHQNKTFASTAALGDMTINFIDTSAGGCCGARKWLKSFHDAPLVVFTYDMASYDRIELLDGFVYIHESLFLFESIAKGELLQNTHIALLLLSITEFKSKLTTSPLSKIYPEYTGGDDSGASSQYILGKFLQLAGERKICHHFADLFDQSIVDFLSRTAKEAMLNRRG